MMIRKMFNIGVDLRESNRDDFGILDQGLKKRKTLIMVMGSRSGNEYDRKSSHVGGLANR